MHISTVGVVGCTGNFSIFLHFFNLRRPFTLIQCHCCPATQGDRYLDSAHNRSRKVALADFGCFFVARCLLPRLGFLQEE